MRRFLPGLAAGLFLLASQPAQARIDWFCGLGTAHLCPGMILLANRHGGHVSSHLSAAHVADEIARTRPARVILAGHSAGCSAAVHAAWKLHARRIPIDLLLCFDGASMLMHTKTVPPNVRHAVSWRQNGFLGGARLCLAAERNGVCRERRGNTLIEEYTLFADHFTIGGFNQSINAQVARLIGGKP